MTLQIALAAACLAAGLLTATNAPPVEAPAKYHPSAVSKKAQAGIPSLRKQVAQAESELKRTIAEASEGRLCCPDLAIEGAQLQLAETKADLAAAQKNSTTLAAELKTIIKLREKQLARYQDALQKGAIRPSDVQRETTRLAAARRRLEQAMHAK